MKPQNHTDKVYCKSFQINKHKILSRTGYRMALDFSAATPDDRKEYKGIIVDLDAM